MRELLVGYLLGALEPEEQAAVEQGIASDESLQADLARLEQSLGVLHEKQGESTPEPLFAPAGLATRTCEKVAEHNDPKATTAAAASGMSAEYGAGTTRGWSLLDYGVAAAVVIAAGMLVLPAISQSRFHSRLLACQDNLRQVGRALDQYTEGNGGEFPKLQSGDVAGKYGPELVSGNLLEPRNLICPNSPLYEEGWKHLPNKEELVQFASLSEAKQKALEQAYGYTLGFQQNGKHYTRINDGDPHYAVVADAPSYSDKDFRSFNHGGCGQNVLFEDGHVRYVNGCRYNDDHIYTNHEGKIDLGLNANDAVIVPANYVLK